MITLAVTRLELFVIFRERSLGTFGLKKSTLLSKKNFSELLSAAPASIPVSRHSALWTLAYDRINAPPADGVPAPEKKLDVVDPKTDEINYRNFLLAFEPEPAFPPDGPNTRPTEEARAQLVAFLKKKEDGKGGDKLNRGRFKALFFFYDENNNGKLGQDELVHGIGELNRRLEKQWTKDEATGVVKSIYGTQDELTYAEFQKIVQNLK